MENITPEVLVSAEEIRKTNQRLGKEITAFYRHSNCDLIVVGLLRGSFIFTADLVRHINLPMVVDFMTVSSYGNGTESTGDIKIIMDLDESILGKDILLVEDIVDTGNTLSRVFDLLAARQPASIRICSFLDKPSRRQTPIKIDFCGKEIPDEFVVGYGLDYAQHYRNLPYVGVLKI